MIYTREELLSYCKSFVIPKSKDIKQWESGENFCISFLETDDSHVLFVGNHLFKVLGIKCEEHECLKYSYALLTFLMCDNIYEHVDFKGLVQYKQNNELCYNSLWFNKLFITRNIKKSAVINNIKQVCINYNYLKNEFKFSKDTSKFCSGSCNLDNSINKESYACINCKYTDHSNYCIQCNRCQYCNYCINNYGCTYCSNSENLTLCKNSSRNTTTIVIHDLMTFEQHDIKEIVNEENYKLPIVKVLNVNNDGWRIEYTSKEYILIYDPENTIRFKGRLTNKNAKKLELENSFLYCGLVYSNNGTLLGIAYFSRSSRSKGTKLSVIDFCNNNYTIV